MSLSASTERRIPAVQRALGGVLLAVVLTGCVKIDSQLELHADDTADGSVVVALSKDLANVAGSLGGQDLGALFDQVGPGIPEGTESEPYEDDDYVGQRYEFEGTALSEISRPDAGFSIVHSGEEFVVEGLLPMSRMTPEGMNPEDLGDSGFGDQLGGLDLGNFEDLMDSMEVQLQITFPGRVLEANGEIDGDTVTWRPVPGEDLEIMARAADSGGGGGMGDTPVWIWIVVAAVVVIGMVVLLLALSRNRAKDQPPAAETTPPPPPPADEPPPR